MLKEGHKTAKKPLRSRLRGPAIPDFLGQPFKPDEWSQNFGHIPVLPNEVLWGLDVRSDGFYVDLTLGGGGHSRLILSKLGPRGKLLAVDRDPESLRWATIWGQGDRRLILKKANFADLETILAELKLGQPQGILADLGLSSRQLFGEGRGFSWLRDEPLDMRMDPESEISAFDIINNWSEKQLIELIRYQAEERSSLRLTKTIIAERAKSPVKTTGELAGLVSRVLRRSGHHARTNPATKVFMGIRLAVNQEMEALATLLKTAPGSLKPGGRLVVISFHSLEDRQVKHCFASVEGQKIWDNLCKKPLTPTPRELEANPRSRSAKLRVGRLIPQIKNAVII